MRRRRIPLTVVAGCAAGTLSVQAAPPVVMDGRFEDWTGTPALVEDPADAPGAELDIGTVQVRTDAQAVHLLVTLGRPVSLQRLDGRLELHLDTDGIGRTGAPGGGLPGADLAIVFSPRNPERPERPGMGAGIVLAAPPAGTPPLLSPYDAGVTFAPTHASDRYEIRLDRGARLRGVAPLFTGSSFRGRFVLRAADGSVADETDVFRVALDTPAAPATPADRDQPVDPIARADGTALRVVSWNAEFGKLFSESSRATRTLRALRPDVVVFQELNDDDAPATIERVLDNAIGGPDREWRALIGSGGGNLRCAVVTPLPMRHRSDVEPIPYPGTNGRFIRSAGTIVEHDGRALLVLSVHLKCCGKLDDSSDRKRRNEVTAINAAVRRALAAGDIDGVVLAGDLNLVGGRLPLELLAEGGDLDGTTLAIAEPLQVDGRTAATWTDPKQPFVAGRLDYMLFSDSRLTACGGFVLDTTDLAPRWLEHHGLRPGDTPDASDHLPVVLDLAWSGPAAPPATAP